MKSIKQIALLLVLAIVSCKSEPQKNELINGSELEVNKDSLIKNWRLPNIESVRHESVMLSNCTPPTTRVELESIKSVVKIYSGKDNAGISIPGFAGLKLGKDEMSVSAYYLEPKLVKCGDSLKVFAIGYSTHLLVKKIQRGLSIDNLPTVAASIELGSNKTEVMYSLQSYGIAGDAIVKFFKPVINKPFDVEGFANMQGSIDGIHAFLSDSTLAKQLRFTPSEIKFITASDIQ